MTSLKWWVCLLGVALLMTSVFSQEDDDEADVEDIAGDDGGQAEEELNVPKAERPVYKPPKAKGTAYLAEPFVSEDHFKNRWIWSKARKDDTDDEIAKYDGKWSVEEATDNPLQNDLGLVLKSKAKHHAISTKLDKPFKFDGKPFVVQYEVKFQNGQECGGAYIKLLTEDKKLDLNKFYDKTPFTVMFGPDRCGNDDKLHFIFRHKNPVSGDFEEKQAKKTTAKISTYFTDKRTHLYRLVLKPDNSFEVSVDHEVVNSGSLLKDVDPAVNPAKEIVDPDDKKPADWDDKEKIADPEATKPEDWDETATEYITDPDATKPEGWLDDEAELIPDPESEKPSDWDEDMDGAWEPAQINNPVCESAPGCGEWNAPQIKNPAYKGKWSAPKIDNPNYKGKWKPRMIANPNYFEDSDPYMMSTISALGLELWSMSDDILFDNFLITDDVSVANQWAADTFDLKVQQELARTSGKSVVQAVMDMTNERPWLWAIILLVVVLPIVLLIAYCCSSGSSNKTVAPAWLPAWVQWLLITADQHKWLYGVYVGVVLIPALVASVWLCPGKAPSTILKENQAAEAADRKKTDAPSPDDDDDNESDDEEEVEAPNQKEESSEENGSGDKEAKSSPKKENKKKSKSDLETEDAQEADVDEEEEDAEESTPTRSSPRKRKSRARKD